MNLSLRRANRGPYIKIEHFLTGVERKLFQTVLCRQVDPTLVSVRQQRRTYRKQPRQFVVDQLEFRSDLQLGKWLFYRGTTGLKNWDKKLHSRFYDLTGEIFDLSKAGGKTRWCIGKWTDLIRNNYGNSHILIKLNPGVTIFRIYERNDESQFEIMTIKQGDLAVIDLSNHLFEAEKDDYYLQLYLT